MIKNFQKTKFFRFFSRNLNTIKSTFVSLWLRVSEFFRLNDYEKNPVLIR